MPDRYSSIDSARPRRYQYERLLARLKSERSSFDSHWKELSDWIRPRRSRFTTTDRNKGDKRNQNIINSTAKFSSRTLASGLHAGLTSPARPWFKLGTPDPDLSKFGPVKEWLHIVTQRMISVFLTTNVYNTLPVIYGDAGDFGTAAMSMLPDSKDLFRTYQYPIGSYYLGQDERGNAATFIREYELTVRQIVREFLRVPGTRLIDWSKASPTLRSLWDQGDYEAPVKVVWCVTPNEEPRRDRLEAKDALPWRSCWWEFGEDAGYRFLRESGFKTFPIFAPRWDTTAEDTYGTDSPGMTALGDVRQLQIEERRKGQGIAKMVDPPLKGPASLKASKTSLVAGDVTYVDVREGQQGLAPIHETNLNLEHLLRDMQEVQFRIQRAYYEDLFLMLARSDLKTGITATEIAERKEEKLIALGPVLERTNDELLEPMIDRAFMFMQDGGLIPEPPDELDGVELKVEYLSIMAQAQKLVGLVGQDRFIGSILPLIEAQVDPIISQKIEWAQIVDNYADMTGIDPRIVVPTDDAKARAAEQQQAAAAAQQSQQAALEARAAKDASGAKLSDGTSALDAIVSAAAGNAAA